MNNYKIRNILLIIIFVLIVGVIWYLDAQKSNSGLTGDVQRRELSQVSDVDKAAKYSPAVELVEPQGFINSKPFKLADYIGKQVILVDFWTYSCINCQRTTPYLNAWWDKYKDEGLLIVGVHTPEFEFEKEYANVLAAVSKFNIAYPVVQDNNYTTWRAYGNRYWPRKYLIDIDGYIVYDHIGEGGYEETERKIQELLNERMARLGGKNNLATDVVSPADAEQLTSEIKTPEIYFGTSRNEYLGNGELGKTGQFSFSEPNSFELDKYYLSGDWLMTPEYVENLSPGAKITLRYRGQKVFLVAGAELGVNLRLTLDGRELGEKSGSDVDNDSLEVSQEGLYRLIEADKYGEHILEIIIEEAGLQAFTFTFG